ncbi:MAG: hypothetical protein IRZ16_03620 [Myxococcaceae bacterium]|nr:hypothetical protein [Myxococcaceae bacterium]
MRKALSLLAVFVTIVPAGAWAKSVYLNNIKIDNVALKNMKFEKVTVRIDEKGDIFIDAPGYQVKVVEPGASGAGSASSVDDSSEAPRLTKRYFLVTEQTAPGMTDYDIDVYFNSKWIRKLKNNEEQIYTDVTKYLQPGRNTVTLVAKKIPGGSRSSYSPSHVFRVIVGEGNIGGDNVMIDRPVVDWKVTAADQDDLTKEVTFTTR